MQHTVSEVKKQFNQFIASEEPVLISRNGTLVSALVPYEKFKEMYQSWLREVNLEAIEAAKRYHEGGEEGITQEELDNLLKE